MSNDAVNYWKFATIGILLVGATAAATLLIVGHDSKNGQNDTPASQASAQSGTASPADNQPVSSTGAAPEDRPAGQRSASRTSKQHSAAVPPPPPSPYPPQGAAYPASPAYPPPSVMEACNKYANDKVNSKTEEVLKNAALGAAIGAAVGAAGGAIAGGGSGAGKGAAIGGATRAAGGTLYGLNENKSHDAQYQAAYASCMRSKGY